MKNLPFRQRLGFALFGIRAALQSESSFRFQVAAGALALVALAALGAPPLWWGLMILMIAAIWAAELFNTALEHLVDRLHPERHPTIKIAKDCAAGAVLVLSLSSLFVFGAFLADRFLCD